MGTVLPGSRWNSDLSTTLTHSARVRASAVITSPRVSSDANTKRENASAKSYAGTATAARSTGGATAGAGGSGSGGTGGAGAVAMASKTMEFSARANSTLTSLISMLVSMSFSCVLSALLLSA